MILEVHTLQSWLPVLTLVGTVAGPAIGYALGKRSRGIENKKGDLENIDKILHIYRESLDDFKSKLDDIYRAYDKLENMYTGAMEEITKLKLENKLLKEERAEMFAHIRTCNYKCNIKDNYNETTSNKIT